MVWCPGCCAAFVSYRECSTEILIKLCGEIVKSRSWSSWSSTLKWLFSPSYTSLGLWKWGRGRPTLLASDSDTITIWLDQLPDNHSFDLIDCTDNPYIWVMGGLNLTSVSNWVSDVPPCFLCLMANPNSLVANCWLLARYSANLLLLNSMNWLDGNWTRVSGSVCYL